MLPLLEAGVEDNSPTSDEWHHFIRGLSFWATGDSRLSYAHPPLANAIAGIPFLFDDELFDLTTLPAWKSGSTSAIYTEYTSQDYAHAREQLVRGRRMMFVFPLLLVCYCYWFCLREFGWTTAAAASSLLAFNPNVLAHGSLVTTDLPAALGYLVAAGEFARYLRGPPSSWRLLTMALAVGLAVLFKHSGILIIPGLVGLGLIAALAGWGVFAEGSRRQRLGRYAGHIGATILIVAFVVNAGYRFQSTGMRIDEILAKPEPQYWVSRPYEHEMLERLTVLDSLPGGLRIPVPYTELFGVVCIGEQNRRGWYRSYFFGSQRSNRGHPLYFPVLFAIKTPVAVLVLLIAGLVVRRPRRALPSPTTLVLSALFVYFLALIIPSNLNMGMRHAMPAVPLLTILAARGFAKLWEHASEWPARSTRSAMLVHGLLVATLGSMPGIAAISSPHYLGWFNALVGRDAGHWVNIIGEDWGQDWVRAVRRAEANGYAPLYIVAQPKVTRLELDWIGVPYTALTCKKFPERGSYVLLRAADAKTRRENCHLWMVDREPIEDVFDHIYVYWIPKDAVFPDPIATDDKGKGEGEGEGGGE